MYFQQDAKMLTDVLLPRIDTLSLKFIRLCHLVNTNHKQSLPIPTIPQALSVTNRAIATSGIPPIYFFDPQVRWWRSK